MQSINGKRTEMWSKRDEYGAAKKKINKRRVGTYVIIIKHGMLVLILYHPLPITHVKTKKKASTQLALFLDIAREKNPITRYSKYSSIPILYGLVVVFIFISHLHVTATDPCARIIIIESNEKEWRLLIVLGKLKSA